MSHDRHVALKLLETAALVEFEVAETEFDTSAPEGSLRMVLQLADEDVEWVGLPLLFALAALSFAEARPAGASELDYTGDHDELTVEDLHEHFRFVNGKLYVYIDYLRGRLVKTTLEADKEGRVTMTTVNRGRSGERWVDLLRGKHHLQVVTNRDPDLE